MVIVVEAWAHSLNQIALSLLRTTQYFVMVILWKIVSLYIQSLRLNKTLIRDTRILARRWKLILRRPMTVLWDCLRYVTRRIWFDSKWLGWMEGFVFTSFISILVNGSSTEDFKISRDLYRGDPVSPFIFLLVEKV